MEGGKDGERNGWSVVGIDRWMEEGMDGCIDGHNEWMDEKMDE